MSVVARQRSPSVWLPGVALLVLAASMSLGAVALRFGADATDAGGHAGPASAFVFALAACAVLASQCGSAPCQRLGIALAGLLCVGGGAGVVHALLPPDLAPAGLQHALADLTPTTAVAVLAAGLVMLVRGDGDAPARPVLIQLLFQFFCLVVLLGGAAQVLNTVIGLDFFVFGGRHYALDWSRLLALVLLGAGLAAAMLRAPWFSSFYHQRPDRQLFAIGASLVLVSTIAAWLIGASAFAGQSTSLLRDILLSSVEHHARMLRSTLDHASEDIEHGLMLSQLEALLDQQAPVAVLQTELQRMRMAGADAGVSAMSLHRADGSQLVGSGAWMRNQGNRQRVAPRSWLFWQDGFWVEKHLVIAAAGAAPFELRVQVRLPDLGDVLRFSPLELGQTREVTLCARRGELMACYPSRLTPETFVAPLAHDGRPSPMSAALDGRQGIGVFIDYRERPVLAAFSPLQDLGLGVVEKVDLAEVHHSLFRQFGYSVLLIAGLMLAGAVFRFRSIRPMVHEIARTTQRLREAQRIGNIVSWELDVASGRIHWSDNPVEILRLGPGVRLDTLAELFGHIAEDDRERVRAALDAALGSAGKGFELEHDYLQPDGRHRTCHVSGEVVRDAAGRAVSVHGLTHDVTERVRAERKIRKREALLNEAERIAHLGSWEWDLARDEQLWSDEIYRQLGHLPGSVAPSAALFRSMVLPEDLAAAQSEIAAIVAARRPGRYQLRIRRPSGEIRYLEANAEAVYDRSGRATRIIGANLDVTERVLAEQQLAHMARLYAVLSRANQAIVRTDDVDELLATICRIAVEDGHVSMAWGCRIEDGHFGHVVHWGDDRDYIDRVLAIYDRMPVRDGPSARVAREGGCFVVHDFATDALIAPWRAEALARGYRSSAAFAVETRGEVAAVLSFYAPVEHFFTPEIVSLLTDLAQDIAFALEAQRQRALRLKAEAELRQLNEELEFRVAERTRALEEANQELESFSYSVSHDLRAPLRSIDGFSQVLVTRYRDRLDDAGRDYLDRVRRAGQRMGQLIDDLLDLSRVTRGALRRQAVNLSALAETVVDELRRGEPERAVDCRIEPGLEVYGDPGLLRALLENLLGNAWKFTRHAPAPLIEFGSLPGDGQRVYYVRDNGAGFDPAYAHKLFKAFQRLHGQDEYEGTGIGLATVQRIIQRHRGRIWAEGAVGTGATLSFTLPLRLKPRDGSGEEHDSDTPAPI